MCKLWNFKNLRDLTNKKIIPQGPLDNYWLLSNSLSHATHSKPSPPTKPKTLFFFFFFFQSISSSWVLIVQFLFFLTVFCFWCFALNFYKQMEKLQKFVLKFSKGSSETGNSSPSFSERPYSSSGNGGLTAALSASDQSRVLITRPPRYFHCFIIFFFFVGVL